MTTWRNRIVGTGEERVADILFNPANWRVHPAAQQRALADVLDEVGWVQHVIVNRRTGHLIDGHLRAALADRRGDPTVPALYVDLSPDEEALVLATLDPIGALAATDRDKLDALLREVGTGSAAVQEMLADLAERSGVVDARPPADAAAPPDEWQAAADAPTAGGGYVAFRFGDHAGRVSRQVYEAFEARYRDLKDGAALPMLDDVLRAWLCLDAAGGDA